MRGDPLEIPVWVRRRGNDKAAAVLQQWKFCVNEPGEVLTIVIDQHGQTVEMHDGRSRDPMTTEEYAIRQKELMHQLRNNKITARDMKRAAKEARKQTLLENTEIIRHRYDIGWSLWTVLMGAAYTLLNMTGQLPW